MQPVQRLARLPEELIIPARELEQQIAGETAEFAHDLGLQWSAGHQDSPVWYVWRDDQEGDTTLSKSVQVGVYVTREATPFVRAVGLATVRNEHTLEAVVPEKPFFSKSKPVADLHGNREVYALVRSTWEALAKVKQQDVKGRTIKLPPRPANWPS